MPSFNEDFALLNASCNSAVNFANTASSGLGFCSQRTRTNSATLTPSRCASARKKDLNSLVVSSVTRSVFIDYHVHGHANLQIERCQPARSIGKEFFASKNPSSQAQVELQKALRAG